MNRIYKYTALLLAVALSACDSQDSVSDLVDENSDLIRFSVADLETEEGSRADVNALGRFAWGTNDTLGIFPADGYQTAFPVSEGTGTSTALFDGGQWALRKNASYAAYFPFLHPMDKIQKEAIPVSYEGQVQNGNNSTLHLGKYDYIAAPYTEVDETGGTTFQLKHLGSLVKFKLTMPGADSYTLMEVSTSAGSFAHTATYSLNDETPALTPAQTSQTIELALTNVSTTESDKTLTLYMFLAPGDYSQYALTVTLSNASKRYLATFSGKNIIAGKAVAFIATCDAPVDNHPYVDLGLPSGTLWATTNIGANNPEDAGSYFAWAETSPKSLYSWANYKYMTSGYSSWVGCSKYTFADGSTSGVWYNMQGTFIGDNKKVLEAMDDAATQNWGDEWCMPTTAQIEELMNTANCTWTWTTSSGVHGFKVTSKTNDNSIFLPAAGYKKDDELVYYDTNGYYWTTSLSDTYSDNAYYLFYYSERQSKAYASRRYGQSVRPVRK